MHHEPRDIDSIFLDAIEKPTVEARNEFLHQACGEDEPLRARVEKLLNAHEKASASYLEKPVPGLPELEQTLDANRAAMDAGLSTTFGPESAVVLGSANHSVLKSLSKKLTTVTNVTLRDAPGDRDRAVRPSSPETPSGNNDSRYQMLGEIARGGMGAIIKGRDTDLGRDLAIKVLLDSNRDRPEMIQRFIEEAQIGGQLQHPGIAPVYELGQFGDERPFFTMKLVKGQTLAAILASRKGPSEERPKLLGIFEQICQTMAYAHSKGVIHRDLKPANIMVGAFGEVQVMDWGLSKVLSTGGVADEQKSFAKQRDVSVIKTRRSVGSDAPGSLGSGSGGADTQHGSVMGTPAYMPPEQALGDVQSLDERADVFGLGAILSEMLTGKPAYSADSPDKVYRMATQAKLDDCLARLDSCGADHELIAIAKSALAAEPDDRTRDAGELSESITNHLESVQERLKQTELARVEAETRTEEERRRKKLYVALAGMAVMVAIGSGVGAFSYSKLAASEREAKDRAEELASEKQDLADAAQLATVKAENATEEKRRNLYESEMNIASQSFRDGNLNGTFELLAKWIPTGDEIDYRGTEWRYLASVANGSKSERLPYGDNIADSSFCFSNDETMLALLDKDMILKLIDFQDEREIFRLDGRDLGLAGPGLRGGSFSPDGGSLILGSKDGVKILDTRSHEIRTLFEGENTSVAVSNDGRWGACTFQGKIVVWDLGTDVIKFRGNSGYTGPHRLQFSPNSNVLGVNVSGRWKVVQLWDVETATRIKEHWASKESYHKPTGFTFLDNESVLCFGPYLSFFSVDDSKGTKWTVPDCYLPTYLATSSDGRRVAVCSKDLSVHIFDINTGKLIWRRQFEKSCGKVKFLAGSEHVVVFSGGSLFKCDLTQHPGASQLPQNFAYHWIDGVAATRDAVFSEGGTEIGEVIEWDPSQTEPKQRFRIAQEDATIPISMEASNDGSMLAIGYGGVVRTWDRKTGQILKEFRSQKGISKPIGQVYSVAFSPDNRLIAAGVQYNAVLWSTDGKLIWSRDGHHTKMLFSTDGNSLFVANAQWEGEDADEIGTHNLSIWDIEGGMPRLVKQFRQSWESHNIVASRDGRWLACSVGEELVIYDLKQLAVHKTFAGNRRVSPTMDFSPDGRMLAAGSDNRIRFWNVETGRLFSRIDVEGGVFGLRFVESTTKGLGLLMQVQEAESKSGLRVQWIGDDSTDWSWLEEHRP